MYFFYTHPSYLEKHPPRIEYSKSVKVSYWNFKFCKVHMIQDEHVFLTYLYDGEEVAHTP